MYRYTFMQFHDNGLRVKQNTICFVSLFVLYNWLTILYNYRFHYKFENQAQNNLLKILCMIKV